MARVWDTSGAGYRHRKPVVHGVGAAGCRCARGLPTDLKDLPSALATAADAFNAATTVDVSTWTVGEDRLAVTPMRFGPTWLLAPPPAKHARPARRDPDPLPDPRRHERIRAIAAKDALARTPATSVRDGLPRGGRWHGPDERAPRLANGVKYADVR